MVKRLLSASVVLVVVGCTAGAGTGNGVGSQGYDGTPNYSETPGSDYTAPSGPGAPKTGPGSLGGGSGGSSEMCQALCAEQRALECYSSGNLGDLCEVVCDALMSGPCAAAYIAAYGCARNRFFCDANGEVDAPEECAPQVEDPELCIDRSQFECNEAQGCLGCATDCEACQCAGGGSACDNVCNGGGTCTTADQCAGCTDACDACECSTGDPSLCTSVCGGGTCTTADQCISCSSSCDYCTCQLELGTVTDCTGACP